MELSRVKESFVNTFWRSGPIPLITLIVAVVIFFFGVLNISVFTKQTTTLTDSGDVEISTSGFYTFGLVVLGIGASVIGLVLLYAVGRAFCDIAIN
jgi:hypothetical protein